LDEAYSSVQAGSAECRSDGVLVEQGTCNCGDVGMAVGEVPIGVAGVAGSDGAVGVAVGSDVRCVMLLAWLSAMSRVAWLWAGCDAVGAAVGDVAVGVAVGSDVRCVMLLPGPSAMLRSALLLVVMCGV
jgi:hypothetical protein